MGALQVGQGALSAAQAINTIAPAAVSAISPALSAALTAAGPVLGAVAPFLMALTSWFGAQDESNSRRSWANIGAPLTAMKERAVSSIGQANQLNNMATQQNVNDPATLARLLQQNAGALYNYFGTTEGGAAPNTVGGYYKHMKGEDMSGLNTDTNSLMNSTFGIVQRLHDMGITPAQLNQIPLNTPGAGWGGGQLYGDPTGTYYSKGYTIPYETYSQTPEYRNMQAIERTGGYGITGGPVMSMLAQLNPGLYQRIGGNLNLPPAVQAAAAAQDQQARLGYDPNDVAARMAAAQAQQAFTSGGA